MTTIAASRAANSTMKHQIKNWTVAVAFFGSLLYCCATHSQGELRPKVHSQLFAAQEALKNNMTEAALKFSADVLAVPNLSVMERNAAYRIRAVAASRAQNWDLVFESLEPLVLQKDITAAEKWPMLEALVSASQQKRITPVLSYGLVSTYRTAAPILLYGPS